MHDHHHDHGGGFWHKLKHAFSHSHAAHERVDSALESNDRGIWALKISFVGLAVTALFQVVIVALSGSTALLADTIHNFADAATAIPLWIAFTLIKRGASRRYTYGYGRAEDIAGVIIVLIIFISACLAAYEAIFKLIHPQPIVNIGWVAVAALIGFFGNEAVAVFRIRVGRQIGSAALVADGLHARVDGFTSLSVLIGVGGVALGYPILDPLIGLGITIAILFIVKDAARSIWLRLMDGIEPEILDAIEHAARHVPEVLEVQKVRARWLGHQVIADLVVAVASGSSVEKADEVAWRVETAVADHVSSFGEVHVSVRPEKGIPK